MPTDNGPIRLGVETGSEAVNPLALTPVSFHASDGSVLDMTGPKGDDGEQGERGPQGDTGEAGAKGDKGDTGDQGDAGLQGAKGDPGANGTNGAKGDPGEAGVNGRSAYELAVLGGFSGSQSAWLASLKGDKGDTGATGSATVSAGGGGVLSPTDLGLMAWNMDPGVANTGGVALTATVIYTKVHVSTAKAPSKVALNVTAAGAGISKALCAVFSEDGLTRHCVSDDQAAAFASTGAKTFNLVSAPTLQPGNYLLAFLFVGTTGPTISRGGSTGIVNWALTATYGPAGYRYGSAGTGLTDMPTSLVTAAATPTVQNANSFITILA